MLCTCIYLKVKWSLFEWCKENHQHLYHFTSDASHNLFLNISLNIVNAFIIGTNRGSVVGIATGYGLDDRRVGVRVPVQSRILTSPYRQTGIGIHPTPYITGTGGSFPGCKMAGVWSWPLISKYCRGQENVGLNIHAPLRLHGVVLNWLSTGAIL
jgi:hypothetical protein